MPVEFPEDDFVGWTGPGGLPIEILSVGEGMTIDEETFKPTIEVTFRHWYAPGAFTIRAPHGTPWFDLIHTYLFREVATIEALYQILPGGRTFPAHHLPPAA